MQDITHLKPGDKIAINNRGNSFGSHIPNVSYELFTITRTTETQIVAKNKNGNEARFRRKDGAQVGENYINAVEATPDLLEEHKAQVAELKRWRAASDATCSLIGKELHQLKLTTEQLERLAIAWAEITAMSAN